MRTASSTTRSQKVPTSLAAFMPRLHKATTIVWSGMNQEDRLLPVAVVRWCSGNHWAAHYWDRRRLCGRRGVADDVGFIMSWHGEIDSAPALGVQVMSVLHIPESASDEFSIRTTVHQSRLSIHEGGITKLFSTNDPNPQPLGYSESVNIQVTTLKPATSVIVR